MIYTYDFQIADLLFRINSPFALNDLHELTPFLTPEAANTPPNAQYTIKLLPSDWQTLGTKIMEDEHSTVYEWKSELHRYYFWNVFTRDRYVLLVRPRDPGSDQTIYLQEETLERILPQFRLAPFLSPERVLLQNHAFILHASLIDWQGQGILFTGPSGIGKSTQAQLWADLEGAQILNGDRTIIRYVDESFLAYGSPYAGTSGIYRNHSVPIRAIVLLSQSENNHLQPLSPAVAFSKLLPQITALPWDAAFMDSLTQSVLDTVMQIPVYHLACRPNADAVALLKKQLFPV